MAGFAVLKLGKKNVLPVFPHALGLLEPESDAPIILPRASRAERNVQRASTAHCTVNSVLGDVEGTRFQSESMLEYRHKLVLNSFGGVVDMREQVRFRYGQCDEREVVFDLFLFSPMAPASLRCEA